MTDSIFTRIINRELPADIVYEDELCVAFRDIQPKAEMHILVVPKKPIARLVDAEPEDQALLGHLMLCAGKVANQQGYGDAFSLAVNNGEEAGQTVFHLHLHILGGCTFKLLPE